MNIEIYEKLKETIFKCENLDNEQANLLWSDIKKVLSETDTTKTIRKGETVKLNGKGRCIFERFDTYFGETTAQFRGIDYPGTFYEKFESLEKQGISVIDN